MLPLLVLRLRSARVELLISRQQYGWAAQGVTQVPHENAGADNSSCATCAKHPTAQPAWPARLQGVSRPSKACTTYRVYNTAYDNSALLPHYTARSVRVQKGVYQKRTIPQRLAPYTGTLHEPNQAKTAPTPTFCLMLSRNSL